jgi:predicted N-acetyltransferase YhbS
MARSANWHIVPLDIARHNRADFSSGSAPLDSYLKQSAGQDIRRNLTRVFVATAEDEDDVVGYYAISATSIRRESLQRERVRKLPRYPSIPAALIGRLAVDSRYQRAGLGALLLIDALARILSAGEILAVQAVVVDAKGDTAAAYYARSGFEPLTDDSRLYLPIDTVKRLIEK